MLGLEKKSNLNEVSVRDSELSPFNVFYKNMNNMFDNFFSDWDNDSFFGGNLLNNWSDSVNITPRTDVREDDKGVHIEAELPGMDKDDINIEICNGILSIQGEKKNQSENEDGTHRRSERSYGYFKRSMKIDPSIDEENIKASYENGVLKIDLPKNELEESQKKTILIK